MKETCKMCSVGKAPGTGLGTPDLGVRCRNLPSAG